MGKPGTKKTLTLRTFMPEEYRDLPSINTTTPDWAYIYACDRKKDGGMAVLRGVPGIDYDVFVDRAVRPIVSVKRPRKVEPREPKSIEMFVEKVYEHDKMIENGEFPYHLVALDTITGLATGLFEEIMFKKRVDDPETKADVLAQLRPSLYEIGDAQWYIMDYIKAILQFPCITVVVAHTAFNKDSDGEIRMFPKLPGQAINDDFLSLFDEVYYFEQGRGETEVKVRTEGTLTIPARTSQPALDTLEVPDYQVWRKKMEAYYATMLSD
jgi:mannose-6-phosphate isomerase-like protein (cupin superfamily)